MTSANQENTNKEEPLEQERLVVLAVLNVLFAIGLVSALISLVAMGKYADTTDEPGTEPASNNTAATAKSIDAQATEAANVTIILFALITIAVAGGAGGVLCNLRGIFERCRNSKVGAFPKRLELPFYIRPFLGAVTGLFALFVGDLVVSTLSLNNTTGLGTAPDWLSMAGRLRYIAIAILAGFAAQEFMQRLKEVAKTLFAQTDPDDS